MIHEKTASPFLNSRLVKWAAVFVYASFIFFLSSQTVSPHILPPFFMFDKVLHFFEYGVLGGLLYFALTEEPWAAKPVLFALVLGTIYGMTDEFHQYFVPTRETDVFDLFADAAGSGAGAFFASFLRRGGPYE